MAIKGTVAPVSSSSHQQIALQGHQRNEPSLTGCQSIQLTLLAAEGKTYLSKSSDGDIIASSGECHLTVSSY